MHKQFNSPQDVVENIRQRADDIDFVEICTNGFAVEKAIGCDYYVYHPDMVMRVALCDTHSWFIHREAATILLNDGILNRLNIQIKLADSQKE